MREHGTGIVIPRYGIHPYYTPFFIKFQAKSEQMAIFVDYDDSYVNIIMSTNVFRRSGCFTIFNYRDNI